jgi:hypothetical protein
MKVAIVYLMIWRSLDPKERSISFYAPQHARFFATYDRYRPSLSHELHITYCGDDGSGRKPNRFSHYYNGTGWDIGAHQRTAKELDADFVVFLGTSAYFWKEGWLERLVEARERFGDGLYGPMASYENSPHIRSTCYACSPKVFTLWVKPLDSRQACAAFESFEGNFSHVVRAAGLPVKLVTWDGFYDLPDWRKPENIFRRGDQSACIVKDRHVDLFAMSDPEEQRKSGERADGK